jgi:monoamine oxidase
VSEFIYLGLESKMYDWVEAQEKDAEIVHLMNVCRDMCDDEAVSGKENMYSYLVNKGVAQRVLGLADTLYAKTWAADLNDLNVRACKRENNKPFSGDDNYILEHSTKELVEALVKPVDASLNKQVVSIETKSARETIVKTKCGCEFKTQKVIVCVPITSVKDIHFSPALPSWYDVAMQEAGVGVSIKGVLRFKQRFWPKDMLLVFCADCVCPQLWMDPERPNYPQEEGHAVTMFVTGTQAKALFELPTWKVIQLFLTQLDNMFGSKTNRRPASALYDDHSICKWDSVAYTYPTSGDPTILCGPINQNSVYFAGEHCGVEASEIATINGAMESGKKAAERVVAEGFRKSKM